jgi:hypothetical protein
MRDYPIFVPHGQEHLAVVLTLPDQEILGLTLLFTGVGATRSHRYQLWTRTARRLAERGVAVARMEYLGVGDSTGEVPRWQRSAHGSQLEQAASLADTAMRVVGVDSFGVVGNCFGALVALDLMAGSDACTGAVCFLPLVDEGAVQRVRRRARRWAALSSLGRSRLGQRLVVEPARRVTSRVDGRLASAVRGALSHGRVLFVYGQEDQAAAGAIRAGVQRALARLPAGHRGRFDLVVLPERLTWFDSMTGREAAIETVEGFMAEHWAKARA